MRVAPLAMTLALGLAAPLAVPMSRPATAQELVAKPFTKGTQVILIGEVSSQPRDVKFANEKKMQVAVGPDKTDHTLHLKNAKIYGMNGQEMGISDIQDGMWVRAEGTLMKDARRIEVTALRVVGGDWGQFQQSKDFHVGWERGYVQTVAGSRQIFPGTRNFTQGTPVTLVGWVSSQPRDVKFANEKKLQVAVGPDKTDYTLHLKDAKITNAAGAEFALSDIRDKMWLKAEGKVMDDARRIEVTRVWVLGRGDAAYRSSSFYRAENRYGYLIGDESAPVPQK